MGSYKEEEESDVSYNKYGKIARACVSCLASLLISMVGGLILLWWQLKYHPTNKQLWMVPFALIILVTPVVVWFSAFVSDFSTLNQSDTPTLNHQPAATQTDDLER